MLTPGSDARVPATLLDAALARAQSTPDAVWLTQPLSGGQLRAFRWGEAFDEARRMASWLQADGLRPGDRVGILSKNCAWFFLAELAVWLAGGTTVALFPTETPATLAALLTHSGARWVFIGRLDGWAGIASALPQAIRPIAFPDGPPELETRWDAVVAASTPIAPAVSPPPDAIAMVIYTSGSTGEPKGVLHAFAGISAAADGIVATLGLRADDRMLSYLPLAHVYERAFVFCASLVSGQQVFFAASLDTFLDDLKRARPTLFLSVPRLWVKFQQGVFARTPPRLLDLLLAIPGVGGWVGRRVRAGLGLDAVRIASSGSAPIPVEVLTWYRRIGLPLLEGYAMTEDFAYSHYSTLARNRPGTVGMPWPGVSVRIDPETDEVQIRSPARLVGYLDRPDLTDALLTPDGYVRTGDRGVIEADGLLRLTGRIKELFKTSKGKYVAPAPIENRLNAHPLVGASCVAGAGQPQPFALVVLSDAARVDAALPGRRAALTAELEALRQAVNGALPGYEALSCLVVWPEPWTIENGALTPTMKIKRARIEAMTAAQVPRWYAQGAGVVWAEVDGP
jgi:long-chain acyl-CoA synthetase